MMVLPNLIKLAAGILYNPLCYLLNVLSPLTINISQWSEISTGGAGVQERCPFAKTDLQDSVCFPIIV